MSGYVRQATANIQSGKVIYAEDLNAELNALSAAFSGSTGHIHDGSTGNGPKIELSNSVVGTLPLSNGGTGATNATGARTNIGANNATNLTAGTLPAARLSGNYSFGNLTLSGTLTTEGTVSVGGNLRVGESFIRGEEDTLYIAPNTGDASGRQVIIRPRGYGNDTNQIVFSSNGYIEIPNGGVTASGTFTGNGSGLTNLNASRVTTGTLPAARLPNHSADLLTSGTLPSGRLSGNYSFGSLTLSGNLNLTSGNISGDSATILTNPGGWAVRTENNSSNYILSVQSSGGAERFKVAHGAPLLYGSNAGWSVDGAFTATTISGTLSGNGSGITNLNASNVSSGTLNANRIPNLNASKVTAGSFHVDRIPNLPASKVTSGTFDIARIPDIPADKVTGTLTTANIPNLPASKVTSGSFNVDRIPNLPASKVTSGTFATDRIPSLDASILGSGTVPAARLSGNYSFGSLTLSGNINLTSGRISGDAANIQTNPGGWSLRTEDNDADYILSVQSSGGVERFKVIHGAPLLQGDVAGWSVDGAFTAQTISSGNYSGNGSGLTNLDGSNVSSGTVAAARIANLPASKITSGTLSNARLSGDYSFDNLTLSGGLSTNAIRVGIDSFHVISRNTTNSWLELEGGNGGSSSSRILLYGPGNSDGRGDLRHGDTVRLRWGDSTVAADNGAGGLYTVATVYPGSSVDHTDFPIGHVIWGIGRGTVDRNASATVRVSSDNTHEYDIAGGTGTTLSGTWRSRGRYNGGNVMQRTA